PSCLGSENMYEQLIDLNENDALLAISAGGPHYAIRTIEAIEFANRKKVPVILVTDDLSNRAVPSATEVICVSSTSTHFSLTPIITILDALLVAIGKRKKDTVLERLHAVEKLLMDQGINN
ncbi:MAG: SIS domain-containing protein, partial [Synergistota bacterium]|nr:SIS domain-containing protein [Synergistota bacterium]